MSLPFLGNGEKVKKDVETRLSKAAQSVVQKMRRRRERWRWASDNYGCLSAPLHISGYLDVSFIGSNTRLTHVDSQTVPF